MKKLIALGSSDWHLNNWNQFNKGGRRVKVSDEFILHLLGISDSKGIPILFSGDMFHTPSSLPNSLLNHYNKLFRRASVKFPKAKIIGITGNHDTEETSVVGETPISYVESYAEAFPSIITCIDYGAYDLADDLVVVGIPYINHNKGFKEILDDLSSRYIDKYKILLIHTNLYGAKDPNGYEVEEVPNIPRNLGRFFKNYDLVLSGHIHKFAKLWADNVVMVGAPYQQRASDSGTGMGYLEIYDDFSIKFIPYQAPEFKYYNQGEELPNDYDYFIEIKSKVKLKETEGNSTFTNTSDRSELASTYCKVKGIKSKRRVKLLSEILNQAGE